MTGARGQPERRGSWKGGDALTARKPAEKPETEEVNAYKAENTEKETVIIVATEFRLAEVLKHIEAGKIVLVIPAPRDAAG